MTGGGGRTTGVGSGSTGSGMLNSNQRGYDQPSSNTSSKTQRKQQMHALQALGERLVALPEAQLNGIALAAPLREAVASARAIRSREGRRRQLQFIGRLMRSADETALGAITSALDGSDAAHDRLMALHHTAERWRDRLIDGSQQATDWQRQYPADAAALSRLIEAARRSATAQRPDPRPARALYRALHRWLAQLEQK